MHEVFAREYSGVIHRLFFSGFECVNSKFRAHQGAEIAMDAASLHAFPDLGVVIAFLIGVGGFDQDVSGTEMDAQATTFTPFRDQVYLTSRDPGLVEIEWFP
jgi:hypothetical protein